MRAGLGMALACLMLHTTVFARAQAAPDRFQPVKERVLPERFPDKPSLPPVFSIPVEPLGFSAPGEYYLSSRISLASLDFIDEDRLLFTFRVPGLIRRRPQTADNEESDERQIRAVVLTLPAGNVESEGLWSVHDHVRYLWMLNHGHFLLRDRNNLMEGDATLELKPWLRFPGPVRWLDLDPMKQFLVTNSLEPQATASKPGDVSSPASAAATVTVDGQQSPGKSNPAQPDLVVRIMRRDSAKVMLVSRVRSPVRLPVNADGYLENLRTTGTGWVLNLNYFTGGSRILGRVDSACTPTSEFISQQLVLATTCSPSGGHSLVALTTDGRTLWSDLNPGSAVWPEVTRSPGGQRIARETLAVTHPISSYAPLEKDDIKGQLVRIFDAATGEMAFESPASPVLDAGGNVAISPSGRRVAVLNAGAIQVFELPPPPPLPDGASSQPGH